MNNLAVRIFTKIVLVLAPAAFLLIVLLVWIRGFIEQQYGIVPSKWALMAIFIVCCWLLVKKLLISDLKQAEDEHKAKNDNARQAK